ATRLRSTPRADESAPSSPRCPRRCAASTPRPTPTPCASAPRSRERAMPSRRAWRAGRSALALSSPPGIADDASTGDAPMNKQHLDFCSSDEWAESLRRYIIPGALEVVPGPGRTTDLLRTMAPQLTAVEIDPDLADALAQRMAGTNVTVVRADA